jgi:malate:Na+ symporter
MSRIITTRESEIYFDDELGMRVLGLEPKYFAVAAAVVLVAAWMGKLPNDMIGGFAVTMAMGSILGMIGAYTPILRDYLGGSAVATLFGVAILNYLGIIPENVVNIINNWNADTMGFINFYIAALITGSILGMNSKLLAQAGLRYFIPLVGGVAVSFLFTGLVGSLMGYGFSEAILYVAAPIMGGGVGAGAVPMSQIYAAHSGGDPGNIISVLMPAVALGNAAAIISGAILNRLGKMKPQLSGNGVIMEGFDASSLKPPVFDLKLSDMGAGFLMALSFYVFGQLLGMVITAVHPYALMIITVAAVKLLGILPKRIEAACNYWYRFIVINTTLALLVGTGSKYLDLNEVIAALTPTYIVLVLTCIIGCILGAGFIGRMVKFYFVESALAAGLCMANMGGTGDVATLGAAERMVLMPFAQMSSRLGGAFILVLMSFLIRILM